MNPLGPMGLEAKLIAGGVVALALAVAAHQYNAHEQELGATKVRLAEAQAQEVEHQRVAQENFRNNELAGTLAEHQAANRVVYATLTREVVRLVDRPVFRNQCLDADGLRLIADAIAGKAHDPSIAASAVPAASAPDRHDGR